MFFKIINTVIFIFYLKYNCRYDKNIKVIKIIPGNGVIHKNAMQFVDRHL